MKKRNFLCLVALIGVGASLFAGCGFLKTFERYENAQAYSAGNFTYQANAVTEIEIDWVDGKVEIVQSDNPTLSVFESLPAEANEDKVHYWLRGNTLKIAYCQSGKRGDISQSNKELVVEIPSGVSLDIEAVGAEVTAQSLQVRSVSVDTKSGAVNGGVWRADEVDVETESGSVRVDSIDARDISVETESGSVAFAMVQNRAEIETARGSVEITLPQDLGARIVFETTRGEFSSSREYSKNGSVYTIGGGEVALFVETTSGDLKVQ